MFYIIWLKLYNFFVIVFKRRFGEKGFGFQSHFDNKTFLSYRNYNHQINCIFFKYPWHKPLTSFIFFETFLALSKNIHGAIFFFKVFDSVRPIGWDHEFLVKSYHHFFRTHQSTHAETLLDPQLCRRMLLTHHCPPFYLKWLFFQDWLNNFLWFFLH